MTVEEIRLEALRLASGCGTPPEEVVKAAGLFAAFLEGKSPSSDTASEKTKVNAGKVDRAATATEVKVADSSKAVETKTADSSKPVETEKKVEVETTEVKVARLAKELLSKSRPKLIAALKELGVERARDLKTAESLEAAVPVLEKALKDVA